MDGSGTVAKVPFEIEVEGKTWKVGHPTRAARDLLEALALKRAWENVEATRTMLPAAFQELKTELVTLIGSSDYKTGGRGWKASVSGPDGNALFLVSLLKEHHPEVTLQDARRLISHRPDDVEVALAAVVPGFFELVADDREVPPDRRAELIAGAAPPRPLTT